MDKSEYLVRQAAKARERAYAPYSGFKVGAALLTAAGEVYLGCNIENAGYTPTNCAERTAFFKAVSEGERHFAAIAVAGWGENAAGMAFPCGVCRQVMMEFCNPDTFQILVTNAQGQFKTYTLKQLLPHGFGPKNL